MWYFPSTCFRLVYIHYINRYYLVAPCSSELDANDKSLFPYTEEVVPCNVHLTGACYTSFRKRVMNKGCKVKRREATREERKASGDTRKAKLYVISITCPVHPTKAADAKAKAALAADAKKKKAQDAAIRKAEKERTEREARERLAALHRANVRERYENIVGGGDEAEAEGKRKKSPGKKNSGTMDTFVKVNVTSDALLKHAQTFHQKRESEIRASVNTEQAKLMTELHSKHAKEEMDLRIKMSNKQSVLMDEANNEYAEIKAKIGKACTKNDDTSEKVAGATTITKENKAN